MSSVSSEEALSASAVEHMAECADDAAQPEPVAAKAEHPAIGRYHDHLLSCYRAGTDSFAKTIIALAGGGLGISVTFLEKLAGTSRGHMGFLITGWVFLVFALGVVLASIHFSNESMLHALKHYPWTEQKTEAGGKFAVFVRNFNWIALAFTLIGLFLLALFAALNMKGR